MNVAQYPHYVYIKSKAESTQDENGFIIDGGEGKWNFLCMGRFEGNGKGSVITTDTATKVVYSGIVYCQPKTFIPQNVQICVFNQQPGEDETINAELLGDYALYGKIEVFGINLKTVKSQLNTKLYIN